MSAVHRPSRICDRIDDKCEPASRPPIAGPELLRPARRNIPAREIRAASERRKPVPRSRPFRVTSDPPPVRMTPLEICACVPTDFVRNMLKQFDRPRLHDVAENFFRQSACFVAADWNDLDHFLPFVVVHQKRCHAAIDVFDLVRLRYRNPKTDSDVLCKVHTAERKHRRMLYGPAAKDHQARDLGTDIYDRTAIFLVVVGQSAFGGGQAVRASVRSTSMPARLTALFEILPCRHSGLMTI